MKKILSDLFLAVMLCITPFVFFSCEKHTSFGGDDITIKPKETPDTTQQPSSDYIELDKAVALNFGDYWTKDADDYILKLSQGTMNEQGVFNGKGVEVSIDLLTQRSTSYVIAPGTYKITYDGFAEYVFLQGQVNDDDTVEPTYIYRQFSSNSSDYEVLPVMDGSLTISYNKTTKDYTVLCNFFDENSKNYKYSYTGPITFKEGETGGQPGGGDDYDYDSIPKNVVIDNVTKVTATNLGNIYDDLADSHIDWEIIIDTDDKAEWVCLEFVVGGDTDASVIPDGTYNLCQEKYLSVGDAVPFVYDEANKTGYGCYYGYGDYYWYGGTKGYVKIARVKDNEYKIDFDIEDENEASAGTFKGSYQGAVDVKLGTSPSYVSGRKFSGNTVCVRMKKSAGRLTKVSLNERRR